MATFFSLLAMTAHSMLRFFSGVKIFNDLDYELRKKTSPVSSSASLTAFRTVRPFFSQVHLPFLLHSLL